jgi:hypothetical protein
MQLIKYYFSPVQDRQSFYDHTKDPFGNRYLYDDLKKRLIEIDVPVEEVDIDINDFKDWLKNFIELKKHYENLGDVFIEKCLEHYLAFRFLKISVDDVYIDVAASESPWADILNNRGIKSYRLDLVYPVGINGVNIGADAGNTNLCDAFASVLSTQCAYECFMGGTDIDFIKEASRILDEKGRFGILPLYLDDTYYVATSPYCNQQELVIESEAKKVWRDDAHRVPFSRHYSADAFKARIFSRIPSGMTGRILYFRNLVEFMNEYPGQMIYCFFMFYCEKNEIKEEGGHENITGIL